MSDPIAPPEGRRPDLIRLAVVLALAFVIRTWLVTHAEVPARDGIGFIRIALRFDEHRWDRVVKEFEQHPGYPLAVLAMSRPVRYFTGGVTPAAMALSAHLVSLIAGVLMVVPVYYLGKTLFSRNAGFLAAALLQCTPVFVEVTSDALSESLFLLFVSSALLFAATAFRTPAPWRFSLCGVFAGLAYLTRPEGLEVVVAVGLVLAMFGLTRWGIRKTTVRTAALAAGVLPLVGLYVGITGHLTNKPTGQGIIQGHPVGEPVPQTSVAPKLVFAAFWNPHVQAGQSRTVWATRSVGLETAKAFHYSAAWLAVVGLVWFRRKIATDPAVWVPLIYAAMHAALLWRMAVVIGYVSERHALPIVLVGSLWAGAVIPEFGAWLATRKRPVYQFAAPWVPGLLASLVMLSGLPSLVKPMHVNRAGHHAAGRWIAGQIDDRDEVIDPFCWAHYYAGCVFREGKVTLPPEHVRVRYVIVEQSGNSHWRLPLIKFANELAKHGERVYHWPEQRTPEKATVVVYRVPAR